MININKLYTLIGIAIIAGVLVGLIFPKNNYYLMMPSKPKREIAKQSFQDLQTTKIEEWGSETYAKWTKKEREFNLEYALVYGALTFGISLFINGIRNKKTHSQ